MDMRKFFTHLEEPPQDFGKKGDPTITSASQVARAQGFDVFGHTASRSPSFRAVGNLEISQINVEAAYFQGSLTSDDPTSLVPPPRALHHLSSADFAGEPVLYRLGGRIWASLGSKDLWTWWRMIRT